MSRQIVLVSGLKVSQLSNFILLSFTILALEKDVVHIKPVAQMGDNAGFMETLKEGKLSTMLDEVCNKTEDPRRFSSLTVTKSKPSTELTHHGASDREKCERASNRRLFNSVCAVSEVKGKPRSDKVENDAKTCKWKRNSADITYKVEAEGEDLDRDTLNSCDMASNKPMVFQIDVSDCNKKINEESLTSQMSDHSRVGASWYKGETGAKSRLSKGGISARRSIADTRTMASFKDKPHQSGPARMKVVEETNSMLEVSPQVCVSCGKAFSYLLAEKRVNDWYINGIKWLYAQVNL